MGRLVLLRHHQADGGIHFDLLLERAAAGERRAITFRLAQAVDVLEAAEFQCERIGDHRAAYFDYEGPIPAPAAGEVGTPRVSADATGPRGSVSRVFGGSCTIYVDTPDLLDVTFDDGARQARFVAERIAGTSFDATGEWRFTRG